VANAPLTVVVGAGISGLSCAYALQRAGQNVLLLEAGPRPGGVIQSVEENGYLFELGPQSFSSTPALYALCEELGLTPQLVEAPRGAPRFILIDGQLIPAPMSPMAFLGSKLLGWKTKFAILTEVLRTTYPPEPDESIAAFTRRKFSEQLLDRLVGPFASGIYAGDPERISLRAAFPKLYEAEKRSGSMVRGMFRSSKTTTVTAHQSRHRSSLLSFRTGNEALVRALAEKLGAALRCNYPAAEIRRTDAGFAIKGQRADGAEEIVCARIVLAAPSGATAQILRDITPLAATSLRQITYAPVAVTSLGYGIGQIKRTMDGFGFLVPRSAGLRTLGLVWNSSLFPGRAPLGHALLTGFAGGATDQAAAGLAEDELATLVHREVAPLLGISGDPALCRVTRYERAIPQYNVGHTELLRSAQQATSAVPGLFVIGNYWNGPAVGACVERSVEVAEQVRLSYNT
jgi:protoporphyrinogen/coproporphyrinogen III oxidase